MYRQGDLLFKKVHNVPKEVSISGDKVLALGESTGHMHQTLNTPIMRMGEDRSIQYLEIVDPDTVVHEEHKPITLEPGTWQVVRQREFDYPRHFLDNSARYRTVMD